MISKKQLVFSVYCRDVYRDNAGDFVEPDS